MANGFGSETVAYIIGILVGAVGGIALLAAIGYYCYRRLGISALNDDDDELKTLRREASMYEEPRQSDRADPVLRPSTSGTIADRNPIR